MNNYFNHIVENLSIDDLKILGILSDEDANIKFKALTRKYLLENTNYSITILDKILERLEASLLVEAERKGKNHKFYITNYGQMALNISLNGVVEK